MTAGFTKGPERVVHQGRVITVAVGEFTTPDGARVERDLVHHPGAVSVVALDGDDVILVRQFRAALNGELLEIPAGLRDVPEEPPEKTAERELAEEIGMHPGKLELLCRFYNAAGFSDEEIYVYLGTDLHPVESQSHGVEEEHMTVERMPFDDAVALIDTGELRDAKSIIGLLLAQRRLGR